MPSSQLSTLDILFASSFYNTLYQQATMSEQEGIIIDSLKEIVKEVNTTNALLRQLIELQGGVVNE